VVVLLLLLLLLCKDNQGAEGSTYLCLTCPAALALSCKSHPAIIGQHKSAT